MGFLDNAVKGTVLTGLVIGIGAAVLAPVVLPVLAGVAKPLAKAAMKSGLLLYKELGRNNFPNYTSQLQAIFARSQITKISK